MQHKKVKTGLGTLACRHMLFLYVILGCDTTFCLYSIGKGTVSKKFKDNVALQQPALIFENSHIKPAQINHTGESVLVIIYDGKNGDTLNALRLHPMQPKNPCPSRFFENYQMQLQH